MPNGEIHHANYKSGYILATSVSLMSSLLDWKFGLGYFCGYTFHRWCDNDWDIMGSSAAEGRMVNELPIIGHILYGVSSSYGSFFRRRHRSFWTHFPVVSTAIRMVWVFIVPFTFLDAYGVNFIGNGWHLFWTGWLLGQSHADAIHWWLDRSSDE
jgi:hypothetical protein